MFGGQYSRAVDSKPDEQFKLFDKLKKKKIHVSLAQIRVLNHNGQG